MIGNKLENDYQEVIENLYYRLENYTYHSYFQDTFSYKDFSKYREEIDRYERLQKNIGKNITATKIVLIISIFTNIIIRLKITHRIQ